MDTTELIDKLEDFFGLSSKKKKKKKEKLLKIIRKLENKKSTLDAEIMEASKRDETTPGYHDMQHEFKVIRRLIKKAKKQHQKIYQQELPDRE